MIDADGVEALLESVAAKISVFASETTASLQQVSLRLQAVADGAGTEFEDRKVAVVDVDEAISRVKLAISKGEFHKIRQKDARLAFRKFEALSVKEYSELLHAVPELGGTWIRRFFAERFRIDPAFASKCAALLAHAPRNIRLMDNQALNRDALVMASSVDSARSLGQFMPPTVPLARALDALTSPGLLDARWEYTALVMATCAASNARSIPETWEAVSTDRRLEAMLLPPREQVDSSWFGEAPRPMFTPSIAAQASFAASLIRGSQLETTFESSSDWRVCFFESPMFRDPREFLDARLNPETDGWRWVKNLDPAAYEIFIDSLLHEDISLFFDVVDMNSDRRTFWLRYVRAASSSVFFLSHGTRSQLEARFEGADASVRAALRRARPLADGNIDAFVLRLRGHVAVEFSQTGNAAYLYDSGTFEKLAASKSVSVSSLKRKDLGGVQLVHNGAWEYRFERELRRNGIQPMGYSF